MRTIKELLELLLQHKNLFDTGMCHWVTTLYYKNLINVEELHILHKFIDDHKKTPILSIQDWWYKSKSIYFWEICKLLPRIHWIKYQIKQLNK